MALRIASRAWTLKLRNHSVLWEALTCSDITMDAPTQSDPVSTSIAIRGLCSFKIFFATCNAWVYRPDQPCPTLRDLQGYLVNGCLPGFSWYCDILHFASNFWNQSRGCFSKGRFNGQSRQCHSCLCFAYFCIFLLGKALSHMHTHL